MNIFTAVRLSRNVCPEKNQNIGKAEAKSDMPPTPIHITKSKLAREDIKIIFHEDLVFGVMSD